MTSGSAKGPRSLARPGEPDQREVIALHRRAMDLADRADEARRSLNVGAAKAALEEAFDCERRAALATADEPSRSVLLRSAASLALEAGHLREAERLVSAALIGEPPAAIIEELRDVLEQVYFSRHLEVRGVELEHGEFQMSIAGDAVGFGMARSERFLRRVEDMQRLLYRTADRQADQPFREHSGSTKASRDEVEVYVSVPRAASFAVSFRLARPMGQELIFARVEPKLVVHEVMTCLALLNDGKDAELKHRIADEAYYRNFIGLAKQLAPDGHAIKLVGLTASDATSGERGQRVAFQRHAKTIEIKQDTLSSEEPVEVHGQLLFADARGRKGRKGQIEIVRGDDRQKVTVPPGMMADIVRPLWESNVIATCSRKKGKLTLIDIQRASEELDRIEQRHSSARSESGCVAPLIRRPPQRTARPHSRLLRARPVTSEGRASRHGHAVQSLRRRESRRAVRLVEPLQSAAC